MAKTFLISYDLKQPGQDYAGLYNAIKSLGEWQHPLESTWVVSVPSSYDASMIYKELKPCADKHDNMFVVEITGANRQGWLAKSFWSWMKDK